MSDRTDAEVLLQGILSGRVRVRPPGDGRRCAFVHFGQLALTLDPDNLHPSFLHPHEREFCQPQEKPHEKH